MLKWPETPETSSPNCCSVLSPRNSVIEPKTLLDPPSPTFTSSSNVKDKLYRHEIGGTKIVLEAGWCDTLIEHYIKKARSTDDDDDVSSKEFHKAFSLLESMEEMSFEMTEKTYDPIMRFLIDRRMTHQIQIVADVIKKEHKKHLLRPAYHEMLLAIRVEDEDKIQMLVANEHGGDELVGYLTALCEKGRRKEVLMILETFDIMKVASQKNMEIVLESLGMLGLESHAKRFIL